jgi:hypothetical protein
MTETETETVDLTTLNWAGDPTIVLRDQDDEPVDWPEDGAEPDWSAHHILLADGFTDEHENEWIVRQRDGENYFIVDSADGESFMSDPGDRYNTRHQTWDTWQQALHDMIGEPKEIQDEGNGFYRISFGPDQNGHPVDLVVQPRPGDRFCAFLENEDEPRRFLGDTYTDAIDGWLGLNDIEPS